VKVQSSLGSQSTAAGSSLAGKVALITGCGRENGIGAAIARRLSKAGAAVIVSDVDPWGVGADAPQVAESGPRLDELAAELDRPEHGALAVLGDVSSESGARELVAAGIKRFGSVDILVNNANSSPVEANAELEDVSVEAWDALLGVGLRGTFLMTRAALAGMRSRRHGRVINVSSVAALGGLPRHGAYSAAKAGILGLTRSVAVAVAPFGITVNAICPGFIATGRSALLSSGSRQARDTQTAAAPVGRQGAPEEVAELAAFLASDSASYITGVAIPIDGGLTAQLASVPLLNRSAGSGAA
jgi:NAD(P)-dependent dehydrogenase (short-subunit alcohol dehydrogenase family)